MQKLPQITQENYFSREIANSYLSCSQVKNFIGTPAQPGCEAKAMAKLKGEYETKPTKAQLVGKYVDAYFSGTLNFLKSEYPELYRKDGGLYADFIQADEIIQVAVSDPFFMQFLSGKSQTILQGRLFGHEFVGRPDFMYDNLISDLKVMADIDEVWTKDYGKLNFIDAWNYPLQGAIYQELDFQKSGIRKPFYLAVLTKEKTPDHEIIFIPDSRLEAAMLDLEDKLPRIAALKAGEETPIRCEKCDYCKSTKKLTTIKNYVNL